MIRITRMRKMRIFLDEPWFLHVDFEVNGTPWAISLDDPDTSAADVMKHLKTLETDIAREIAMTTPTVNEYSETVYEDK